jgi:hypothetical protein
VPANVEAWIRQRLQMAGVEVGDDDLPLGADPVGQPAGDCSAATADLQAAPARRHAAGLEVAHRARVVELGQRAEPGARFGRRVVQ